MLGKSEVDIVNAQIINASNGYALQSFRLAPMNTNNDEMSYVASQIAHNLGEKLDHSLNDNNQSAFQILYPEIPG